MTHATLFENNNDEQENETNETVDTEQLGEQSFEIFISKELCAGKIGQNKLQNC